MKWISVLGFFGGLGHEIQDVLDYKEWTRFPQLYHYALKADREVKGRQPMCCIYQNRSENFFGSVRPRCCWVLKILFWPKTGHKILFSWSQVFCQF